MKYWKVSLTAPNFSVQNEKFTKNMQAKFSLLSKVPSSSPSNNIANKYMSQYENFSNNIPKRKNIEMKTKPLPHFKIVPQKTFRFSKKNYYKQRQGESYE